MRSSTTWILCLTCTCLDLGRELPSSWAAENWVEDSYADFADGRLDAAGQNIYVCRDGSVRTIHRFDLNQDGHLDLVFNNTHDRYSLIPATLARVSADGAVTTQELAVEGSRQVVFGDLNRDGHADAVFCPNAGNAQGNRRFVTIIWGGGDGWPAHRSRADLPVHGARAIALAELNGDGWPDMAVLCDSAWLPEQPPGAIVRIYWGSEQGYRLTFREDLGVANAVAIDSADFDQDGADDLAVLTSAGSVQILSGSHGMKTVKRVPVELPAVGPTCLTVADVDGDGHSDLVAGTRSEGVSIRYGAANGWGEIRQIKAPRATQLTVGDLDADGKPDLVVTHFDSALAGGGEESGAGLAAANSVHILWQFDAEHTSQLPIRYARGTAIGDLNGDGRYDLAVAVHQSDQHTKANSLVFLGQGERQFERSGPIATTGAVHVGIAPATAQGPARAVFANSLGMTMREEVPLQVYWGGPSGFDQQNVWEIPFASGYESTAADLNLDGFVDFIALNSGHAGEVAKSNPHLGANIFWGGPSGFDIEKRRTVLREANLGMSNVADLNRDGYLDLVFGQFSPDVSGQAQQLIVYYGGEHGFTPQRRVAIPSPGRSIGTVIADYNRDRWLDVAVACYETDLVRIFWGSQQGFDAVHAATLPVHAAIDAETADLNADGFLDLIVGSYSDRLSGIHDVGTTVFWGSRSGFRHSNAQSLPGFTPIGHCVADFDGDGHLDLFSPHYHANGTRESLPAYLFWGSETGFQSRRRTALICDSSDDALAADFNRDGKLDLAVVCHTTDATHLTASKIFYNDGQRFTNPRIERLPTRGPHWMWGEDMGHIYHRRWEQTYESSTFGWEQPASGGKLRWRAKVPPGTSLKFAIRAAAQASELPAAKWRPLANRHFSLAPSDRFLEYRVLFRSDNGDRYPTLQQVEIALQNPG